VKPKTRSADLLETGLAGQIDIQTHRPFDFAGGKSSIAARGIYAEKGLCASLAEADRRGCAHCSASMEELSEGWHRYRRSLRCAVGERIQI